MNKEEWKKVVERGAVVPPYFEPARSAGNLYALDENGSVDFNEVVGEMPNTYYDKRYADYYYYSFSAYIPIENEPSSYCYYEFDEDEGTFDDSGVFTEIVDTSSWKTEKEFLKEETE